MEDGRHMAADNDVLDVRCSNLDGQGRGGGGGASMWTKEQASAQLPV